MKVSEERPLFKYVKAKTEEEESNESEDECEKFGYSFEEWLDRKGNGLPMVKAEKYEEEELTEVEKEFKRQQNL